MSKRTQSTKFRSDAKINYSTLKRPHLGRVLEAECPKCGNAGGAPCRSAKLQSFRNRVGTMASKMAHPHRERVMAVMSKPCCYRAPMAPRSARPCGSDDSDDTDEWKSVTCTACLAKQPELALRVARYCGTEFEANLGNARMSEYLDDCALQWGVDDWASLPNDKQLLVRKAFNEGRHAERELNRQVGRKASRS